MDVLSWGRIAVEMFMMLSGFLMMHHYGCGKHRLHWRQLGGWRDFWVRRFFRIAPLYYVMLFVAMLLGEWLGEWRHVLVMRLHADDTFSYRYSDQSLTNILMHVSWVFGALPEYHFRTPLPDWSIGLEVQFYLLFPFLVIPMAWSPLAGAGLLLAGMWWVHVQYADYLQQFWLPSFLPMQINFFLSGMLAAYVWRGQRRSQWQRAVCVVLAFAVLAIPYVQTPSDMNLFMIPSLGVLVLLFLPLPGWLTFFVAPLKVFLASRVMCFLGDISYSSYLLHLLVQLPVLGMLSYYDWYSQGSEMLRFGVALAATLPPVYLTSWVLYHYIELPGIRLGHTLSWRGSMA